ncbi:MAG: hypothetical protein WCT37_03075 [Patescibacteria group bacterium]|jgi:hypothetical protein
MDGADIFEIFYSNFTGSPDYQGLSDVLDLLNRKYIKISKTKTGFNKADYQTTVDKILDGQIKSIDYQGGSNNHLALKVLAEEYIRNNFGLKSSLEYNFFGRIPDVISLDKNIIFECGDTDPWKVTEYFRNDDNLKVFIFPYPGDDEEELFTYEIIKGKEGLKDYLLQKQLDGLSAVKKIIRARKH